MKKKTTKPEAIPLRALVGNDRAYDNLNEECIHMQARYTQLSIENSRNSATKIEAWTLENVRNGMTEEAAYLDALNKSIEPLQKPLKALRDLMAFRDAIKQEKKLLEVEGLQHSEGQSKKASLSRPIKNESGETLDGVILNLANCHPDEKPSELWPHLKTAIDEWSGGDCKESKPDENKADSWRYEFDRRDDSKDSITYQLFRKKLSKIRNGK